PGPFVLDRGELVPVGDAGNGLPAALALGVGDVYFDDGLDDAEGIGLGVLERRIVLDNRFVFVRPIAPAPGSDGAQAVDASDDRHLPLFRLVLVEDDGADLLAEWI